jgi:hypothetical protein
MKLLFMFLCALLAACASDMVQSGASQTEVSVNFTPRLKYPYEPSTLCQGCHPDQYQQYEVSMHAKAFSNPLFYSQYFNNVVPRAERYPEYIPEARKCVACHAPVVFMNYTGLLRTPAQAARYETGVTCDFCHTLAGYGKNGDYEQAASRKKQGPFQTVDTAGHHSEFSSFITESDFCGQCHDDTNHIGKGVRSTYSEWLESNYGNRGLACQECHMNRDGFLKEGASQFASGQAAYMKLGATPRKQTEHEKLYDHSFPGAHSINQLEDALRLEFKVGTRTVDAGGRFPFTLTVNNDRTAHKMPTGSSDLRFMWLVVTAMSSDGTKIPVTLHSSRFKKGIDYSVAGEAPDDTAILKNDVPVGSRLYRSVLVNAAGRQSLFEYGKYKNVFDNRLKANEIRKEGYYLKLPDNFSGKVTIDAFLYYKSAPTTYTRRMQIPDVASVLVASQKKQVTIENSAKK